MSTLNRHQLRQILGSMVGRAGEIQWPNPTHSPDMSDDLMHVINEGLIIHPDESGSDLYVVPQRFPVLTDINSRRRSLIVQCLEDRDDETVVVVDSYLKGKDAIFFARLFVPGFSITPVTTWLSRMMVNNSMSLIIKPIDETNHIMVANVQGFVSRGVS